MLGGLAELPKEIIPDGLTAAGGSPKLSSFSRTRLAGRSGLGSEQDVRRLGFEGWWREYRNRVQFDTATRCLRRKQLLREHSSSQEVGN